MPGTPAGGGGPVVVLTSRREVGSLAAPVMRKGREGTGREGRRVRRGGGGRGRGVCARARGGGGEVSSAAERHRAADRGRGAVGAGLSRPGSPGRSRSRGPRSAVGPAPRSAGTNPAEHHPRGRILAEAGERHAVPSRPNRTGTGPAGWIPGGRAGLGTGAPGPGSLVIVDRRGGDQAGPWAAAGEGGGVEGLGGLEGEPREALGGWARAPRAAVP